MARREEVFAAMRDYLRIQNPEWEIAPGSPEFKILESVAVQLETMTFDGVLNDYHWDIDKKNGLALDEFVSLFGFTRIPAKRATGTVLFKRGTPAPKVYSIPRGTQVFVPAREGVPAIYYQTTETVIMQAGQYSVLAPIEAVLGGAIGNTAAGDIISIATVIEGVTACENTQAATGGVDGESDDDLRARWRTTVFRNMSGTEDQFLAHAYAADSTVARATVVSGAERYREQIQLMAPSDLTVETPWEANIVDDIDSAATLITVDSLDGLPSVTPFYVAYYADDVYYELMRVCDITDGLTKALTVERGSNTVDLDQSATNGSVLRVVVPSSVNDARYVYPAGNEIISSATSSIYLRRGTDYDFISSDEVAEGFVSVLASRDAKDRVENLGLPFIWFKEAVITKTNYEALLDLQFDYCPMSSRNNPPGGLEKVDIFVDGMSETLLSEELAMSSMRFGTTYNATTVDYRDFLRSDGTMPKTNNVFLQLSQSPIIDIDESITVQASVGSDAVTYYKDQDYWLVEQVKNSAGQYVKGSARALAGIEWRTFNYPVGTLSINGSATSTTITVAGGFDAPFAGTYPFFIQVGDERLKVTSIAGTTLTVARAQQGTSASSHSSATVNLIDAGVKLTTADNTNNDFAPKRLPAKYFAYTVTREVNGIESAASTVVAQNVAVAPGKIDLTITDAFPKTEGGTSTTFYVYRSKAADTEAAAKAGPFYYLRKVYMGYGDGAVTITDNQYDSKLQQTFAPSQTPAPGKMLQLNYRINQAVASVTQLSNVSRLVGQDTVTHFADLVPLKFNFAVMSGTANIDLVKTSIVNALNSFLLSKQFQGNVQLADVFEAVMLNSGVDNVRLTKQSESRNEEQAYLVYSDRATGGTSADTYRLTVEDLMGDTATTEDIAWDESAVDVRVALENLPNIVEGFNNISNVNLDDLDETQIVFGNTSASWPATPFYLQICDDYETASRTPTYLDEIVRVTDITDDVLTVERGVLDSEQLATEFNDITLSAHVIGDVAVTRTTQNGSLVNGGTESNPFKFSITFLGERWGEREVPLLSIAATESLKFKPTITSTAQTDGQIARKVRGLGWGIQRLAPDGLTIVPVPLGPCSSDSASAYTNDFYMKLHEIPVLVTADVLIKGRNTF